MPITLTDKAAQEVKNLLAENDKQGAALRAWTPSVWRSVATG